MREEREREDTLASSSFVSLEKKVATPFPLAFGFAAGGAGTANGGGGFTWQSGRNSTTGGRCGNGKEEDLGGLLAGSELIVLCDGVCTLQSLWITVTIHVDHTYKTQQKETRGRKSGAYLHLLCLLQIDLLSLSLHFGESDWTKAAARVTSVADSQIKRSMYRLSSRGLSACFEVFSATCRRISRSGATKNELS